MDTDNSPIIKKTTKLGTWFFLSLLLLSFYYLAYRYPFKINSSSTSPTYSDTPLILQVGKYIIFSGIFYLALISTLRLKARPLISKVRMIELVVYVYIFLMSIVGTVLGSSDYMMQTGMFFCLLIFPYFIELRVDYRRIKKVIYCFIYLAVISEMVQVMLFKLFDRLPALGYYNSTNVRFGSLWDDPNGFAIIIAFLLSFIWLTENNNVIKLVLSISLIITLLLTLSFTGIVSVGAAIIIGTLLIHISQKKFSAFFKTWGIILILGIVLVAVYIFIIKDSAFFNQFMREKQGSISAHINYANQFSLKDLFKAVSLQPAGKYSESGFINILINFGAIYFVLYFLTGIITVLRFLKLIRIYEGNNHVNLYYSGLFFVIAYMIGMLNIPYDVVFPVNLIYVLCILLTFLKPGISPRVINPYKR
ncbi:hypothetical protein [Paenibacillus cineris]|uniref:hypothetical protein n=1 Tax=Paenibacillus cineris TaxID=237530 RepID=UPI001B069ED4|nr:hypothetical protein [Paenibacillus cineris]GIO62466.1 hypothetical protein J43TS9_40400 [Paenibacillus cineris]